MNSSRLSVKVLDAVREAGRHGASLSHVLRIVDPTCQGRIPTHTGAALVGMSFMKLLSGGFIVIDGEGSEDIHNLVGDILSGVITITERSLAPGYRFAELMRGREQSLKLILGRGFYAAQDVLGFSLTEAAKRTDRSVLCNPVFDRQQQKRSDIFVIMPFSEDMRKVFDQALAPAAQQASLSCARGDDSFGAHYVIDDIWGSILDAKYIIADCSNHNPNVFYELGMAHTIGKTTLLITQDKKWIPFDLRHWRYHVYESTRPGLAALRNSVRQFLLGTNGSVAGKSGSARSDNFSFGLTK